MSRNQRRALAAAAIQQDRPEPPYPVLRLGVDKPIDLAAGSERVKAVRAAPSEAWSTGDVGKVAAQAVAAAAEGARVLVIRNTVGLARATAEAVAKLASDLLLNLNGHAVCHHARYAVRDRLELDEVLKRSLHPDPLRRHRKGVVAVATQTAEQSLDVDADLLITDLVPIDVLLQRIGRLHRNRDGAAHRARPDGYGEATCVVLTPTDPTAFLTMASPRPPPPNNWGTDRAYADTVSLAATRELIGSGTLWRIPAENRRLVESATSPASLAALAKRHGWVGEQARMRAEARAIFQGGQANDVRWTDSSDPSEHRFCEAFSMEAVKKIAPRAVGADLLGGEAMVADPRRVPIEVGHDASHRFRV